MCVCQYWERKAELRFSKSHSEKELVFVLVLSLIEDLDYVSCVLYIFFTLVQKPDKCIFDMFWVQISKGLNQKLFHLRVCVCVSYILLHLNRGLHTPSI